MLPGSRCRLVRLAGFILLAQLACAEVGPPNIILISIDTLRADALGSYGQSLPTSPTLDGLAERGVRFSDVITQSTKTGPSHRALMTGVLEVARKGSTTLAQILSEADYETAAFVDGGYMNAVYGHDKGFDLYVDGKNRPMRIFPNPTTSLRRGFSGILPEALEWLESRQADNPFFLFLHTYDVHCPYGAPDNHQSFTQGREEPAHLVGRRCKDYSPQDLSPDDWAWLRDKYLEGVRYVDSQLGRFLDSLEDEGLLDNTAVIVVSDHGESLGERDWLGHKNTHAPQVIVPWIMWGPGLPAGRVVDDPAQLVDLVPTLLDYLDLPSDEMFMGRSLLPAIQSDVPTSDDKLQYSEDARLRYSEIGTGRILIKGPWALEQHDGSPDIYYNFYEDPLAAEARETAGGIIRNRMILEYGQLIERHGGGRGEPLEEVEPDEETLEQLRSLGYVD